MGIIRPTCLVHFNRRSFNWWSHRRFVWGRSGNSNCFPSSHKFHFFLSLQLPFVPCFFPGTGSYPSQQGLGFVVFAFVFFVVFFLTISVLKSKNCWMTSTLSVHQEHHCIYFPIRRLKRVAGLNLPWYKPVCRSPKEAKATPLSNQHEHFGKRYLVLEFLVF